MSDFRGRGRGGGSNFGSSRGAGYSDRGGYGGGRGGYQGRGGSSGFRGGFDGRGGRGRGQPPPVEVFSAAIYPPTPSVNVSKVEDATMASQQQLSLNALSLTDRMPGRPGHGTQGRKITLWTNSFKLEVPRDLILHVYSLDKPRGSDGREVINPKQIKWLIKLLVEQHLYDERLEVATDFASRILCQCALSIPDDSLPIQHRFEDQASPGSNPLLYTIAVRKLNSIRLSDTINYLTSSNMGEMLSDKEEAIQAVNIIMNHQPKESTNILSISANRHFPLAEPEKVSLGGGLEMLRGYFTSVRLATARILLNVQVTHVVLFEAIPLDQFMDKVKAELKEDHPYLLQSRLKFVKVHRKHLEKKTDGRGPAPATIVGLAAPGDGQTLDHRPIVPTFGANAKEVKFYLVDGGTNRAAKSSESPGGSRSTAPTYNGHYISVYDFFKQRYNFTLKHAVLPVVNVGTRKDPVYLPPEVCQIIPAQRCSIALKPMQSVAMTRFTVRRPKENATSITKNGAALMGATGSPPNQMANSFGFSFSNVPITVCGRVLAGPEVLYAEGKAWANAGSWNMQDVKFDQPTQMPLWTYLHVKLPNSKFTWPSRGQLLRLLAKVQQTWRDCGLTVNAPIGDGFELPLQGKPSDDVQIDETFRKIAASEPKPRLLLVILPNDSAAIYNRIKINSDIRYGIHTIMAIAEKLAMKQEQAAGNPQFYANLALKINLKLGGRNHTLHEDALGIVGKGKTMVVGLDVTHPSPRSADKAPSVAAIVASIDRTLAQWPAEIRINPSRQEMVSDLKVMFVGRFNHWKKFNNELPHNILVYRDGVSEGQFPIVLHEELPQIRAACDEVYQPSMRKAGLPNISIIISVKRHNTRFYPTRVEEADKGSNIRNGTVVDRGYNEARVWDFCMAAHQALSGTVRPAKYTIIHDEIFRNPTNKEYIAQGRTVADVVEQLNHNMCYLHGRATKAISIVPAARYADLACDRARRHLNRVFETSTDGTQGQNVSQEELRVHEHLRDTMFYI